MRRCGYAIISGSSAALIMGFVLLLMSGNTVLRALVAASPVLTDWFQAVLCVAGSFLVATSLALYVIEKSQLTGFVLLCGLLLTVIVGCLVSPAFSSSPPLVAAACWLLVPERLYFMRPYSRDIPLKAIPDYPLWIAVCAILLIVEISLFLECGHLESVWDCSGLCFAAIGASVITGGAAFFLLINSRHGLYSLQTRLALYFRSLEVSFWAALVTVLVFWIQVP